jgi:ubiquinone/menaquinone biosynthesis C-methylase UbiE
VSEEFSFDGEVARNQNAISETADFVQQRNITMKRMALQPGERVLDIGVGTGHFVRDMAHATHGRNEIVGIDISEEMLALARARCEDFSSASFQAADLYDLPFEDNSFDVAISVQTFEYLDDVERACKEAFRVIRPGGRFFSEIPTGAL